MIKQFDDYVVNIPGEEEQTGKNYEYDRDKVSQLISENKYVEAANYCSTIEWNDDTKQQKWITAVNNLRREGYAAQAQYNKLNTEDKSKQSFIDALDVDGGLDMLDDDNEYKTQFIEYKRKLGSKLDVAQYGKVVDEATSLTLSFAPEKRYGLFGIDWMAHDNAYNINKFYEMSGLSEKDLKSSGVTVETDDEGNTNITFDKSNALANRIITNIPSRYTNRQFFTLEQGIPVKIQGYNNEGNKIFQNDNSYNESLRDQPVRPQSTPVRTQSVILDAGLWTRSTSDMLFDLVNDSKNDLTEANKRNVKKVHSTVITPFVSDEMAQIESDYVDGKYKSESDREIDMKKAKEHIYNMIISHGSGNYDYKSNYANENEGDETLRSVSNEDRHIILQQLKANKDNLEISACVYNGITGMLISYGGIRTSGRNLTSDNQIQTKETKVFIPGFLSEQVQRCIDNDINTQVQLDLNSMEENGYSITLSNGDIIEPPTIQSNNKFVLRTKDGDVQERELIEDALYKEFYFKKNVYKVKRNSLTINNEVKYSNYRKDVLSNIIKEVINNNARFPDARTIKLDESLMLDEGVNPFVIDDSTIKPHKRPLQFMRDLYDMFMNNIADYPLYNPQIDTTNLNK